MTIKGNKKNSFATKAVRHGTTRSIFGEHSEAIFQTSSFIFNTAEEAAQRFSGDQDGPIYSRFTNPNTEMFEERLASLENAEASCATSTGMSAIMLTCLTFLKSGDRILATPSLFGATIQAFETVVKKFDIGIDYARLTDSTDWEAKLQPSTRLIFLESPSNPLNEIADLKKIAELSSEAGIISVVDNCICTPALQNPLEFGIDLSLHSATKFIDGQGRSLGGIIAGNKNLIGELKKTMRFCGFSLSPFNSWLLFKSLETLDVRMKQHSKSAKKIAEWLSKDKRVKTVYYPGLTTHPQHELAMSQQKSGGALVSFEIKDPMEESAQARAWKIIDNMTLFSRTGNLGDTRSTVTHPATTTHAKVESKTKKLAGITDGLIRLSIGLEDYEDLILDLNEAMS